MSSFARGDHRRALIVAIEVMVSVERGSDATGTAG